MEVCCSSWVSVLSICDTCDWVALIWDWFGAGPGSVVGVGAAPAVVATRGARNAQSIPATIATRAAGATRGQWSDISLRATGEIVMALTWNFGHRARCRSVANAVRAPFTLTSIASVGGRPYGHDA